MSPAIAPGIDERFRRPALLWSVADHDRVECELCPYRCRLGDGAAGVCGVRENRDGTLETSIYGAVAAAAADPIEKKPLYHFFPGSQVYSVGTVGCNMRCIHCQNWELSRERPGSSAPVRYLSPEALVASAIESGCQGVAWTYNEPTIWIEYAVDGARLAKEAGLYTVFVTNGYITQAGLDIIGPHLDAFRVDLKGHSDSFYSELAKIADPAPIRSSAERAKHHWGMHVEVVTNVIPGMNDDDAGLAGMARWIYDSLGPDTPWHLTRFLPYLDLEHLEPTPMNTLLRGQKIASDVGLSFVYLGNVPEKGGADTYCPECGSLSLQRSGYTVNSRITSSGECDECGMPLNVKQSSHM